MKKNETTCIYLCIFRIIVEILATVGFEVCWHPQYYCVHSLITYCEGYVMNNEWCRAPGAAMFFAL